MRPKSRTHRSRRLLVHLGPSGPAGPLLRTRPQNPGVRFPERERGTSRRHVSHRSRSFSQDRGLPGPEPCATGLRPARSRGKTRPRSFGFPCSCPLPGHSLRGHHRASLFAHPPRALLTPLFSLLLLSPPAHRLSIHPSRPGAFPGFFGLASRPRSLPSSNLRGNPRSCGPRPHNPALQQTGTRLALGASRRQARASS